MCARRLSIHASSCLVLSAIWLTTVMAQEPPKSESKGSPGQQAKPEAKPEPKPPETKPTDPKPDAGKVVTSPILTTKLALMADPRLFPYDINVELTGESILLTGKVPDDHHKAAAGEIAKTFAKTVTNNIELNKDIEREIAKKQDDAITQYVKERFAKSKTLDAAAFTVKTNDGVVSLTGKTRFQVIVLEAAEAARQVPGVKAVKTDGVRLEAD